MTTDELIEAVQKAMCCPSGCVANRRGGRCASNHYSSAPAIILAVLDGIREPSEDVLEIGGEAYSDTVDLDVKPITYARAVWSAMIDAKKKEIEGDASNP